MRTKYKILTLSLMFIILTAIACMTMSISAAAGDITVTWGANTKDFSTLSEVTTELNKANYSSSTTYTIKLNADVTISSDLALPTKPVIITAATGKTLTITGTNKLSAQNNVTFKNININGNNATLYGNGKTIVFDKGVTSTSNNYCFSMVFGGGINNVSTSNLIIHSGNFRTVYGAGNNSTVTTANTIIYGGNFDSLCGGGGGNNSNVTTANTTIYGGNFNNVYNGGSSTCTVTTANMTIAGGTINNVYTSVYGGGNVTTSNITYIGGKITNGITKGNATNVYGYLIANRAGTYPTSPFKTSDYTLNTNLFKIGTGFTKVNDTNFALQTMQVNFDSSALKTGSSYLNLQYFDETSGTWKAWTPSTIYSQTGNYEMRFKATGSVINTTNVFTFEQKIDFFVFDGSINSILQYLLNMLSGNAILNSILNIFSDGTSILSSIFEWLFGDAGILGKLFNPSTDSAFLDSVYEKLTNLDELQDDSLMSSITNITDTDYSGITDKITEGTSGLVDAIKDGLNGSSIIENIIGGIGKILNP